MTVNKAAFAAPPDSRIVGTDSYMYEKLGVPVGQRARVGKALRLALRTAGVRAEAEFKLLAPPGSTTRCSWWVLEPGEFTRFQEALRACAAKGAKAMNKAIDEAACYKLNDAQQRALAQAGFSQCPTCSMWVGDPDGDPELYAKRKEIVELIGQPDITLDTLNALFCCCCHGKRSAPAPPPPAAKQPRPT